MRVPVADLIGHPGETRPYAASLRRAELEDPAASWGPADDALVGPIDADLQLDSVIEGILARGELRFTAEVPCARCLRPISRDHVVAVSELFEDPARREPDDDQVEPGYEIVDDLTAIDLTTMVRDAVLMDLPVRVLCREDCQGLCPTCGADRNVTDCGHEPEAMPDPRWGKLAELDLSD